MEAREEMLENVRLAFRRYLTENRVPATLVTAASITGDERVGIAKARDVEVLFNIWLISDHLGDRCAYVGRSFT